MEGNPSSGSNIVDVSHEFFGSDSYVYSTLIPFNGRGGDINGDGLNDVLIGGHGEQDSISRGVVRIMYGPIEASKSIDDADAHLWGEEGTEQLYWPSIVGDTNSDGFDDILIGAPYDSTGGKDAGAVYLILGGGL